MTSNYKSFLKQFLVAFAVFLLVHWLVQVGYPMLKGKSFADAMEPYRLPFTAIPIAVAVALVRSRNTDCIQEKAHFK